MERIQDAGLQLVIARKETEAAQAQLNDLLAGADPESLRAASANLAAAEAQRDGAQAQLELLKAGSAPDQIAEAQAQVDQARAALTLAQLTLDRATLSAPFDGEVAAVNVKTGEMANVAYRRSTCSTPRASG